MVDMLVKLYELPEAAPLPASPSQPNIVIRRAYPHEKDLIAGWVARNFKPGWAKGVAAAIEYRPVQCFIAVEQRPPAAPPSDPYDLPPEYLVGFICYDVAFKGILGPLGVHEDYRSRGIGRALLLEGLRAMRDLGYAYAVLQWVVSEEYYARAVGAISIPDTTPGSTRRPLAVG